MAGRPSLRELIQRPMPVTAPLVLNPLMARMAEAAGFPAGYLGGGSTGYQKVALEANLNVTEMCQAAVDIGAVCSLPLILDGACGYGDPMHMHRTIGMSEAAGFAAIEIEDQLVPKRAHHHAGIEHMIPAELMAAKVKEAVAARRNPDFLIVARTNAIRASTMDDALRRGEAMKKAGADMLFLWGRKPEEMRFIAERLPAPLMTFAPPDGFGSFPISRAEMAKLGYRLAASSGTAFAAMMKAVRQSYECLTSDSMDPFLGPGGAEKEMKAAHKVTGLDRLIEIERRTMKEA